MLYKIKQLNWEQDKKHPKFLNADCFLGYYRIWPCSLESAGFMVDFEPASPPGSFTRNFPTIEECKVFAQTHLNGEILPGLEEVEEV